MVAYTNSQQSERLRGERDQIKFIDLIFERWKDETYHVIRYDVVRHDVMICYNIM